MKLILVDVLNEVTKEYITTEIYPLVSKNKAFADIYDLRDRGLHIPTLVRMGKCEYRDERERYVIKTARFSLQGSFIVPNLAGSC